MRVPTAAWLILVLALVVRLGYVAGTPEYRPDHDDRDYDRLACALVDGGGFAERGPHTTKRSCGSFRPGRRIEPTAFRPPGYPLFLAGTYGATKPLTHDRVTAARLVQAVLGTLVVALIGLVAAQLLGRRTALVAMALGAVCMPLVVVGGTLLSETLFVALELGAVAALLAERRARRPLLWVALAGVLVGLATLTRTNAPVLLVVLVPALLAGRSLRSPRAFARPLLLLAVAALVVAPWTIRNASAMHAFVPVNTESGSALVGVYNDSARNASVRPGAWLPRQHIPELRGLLARDLPEPELQRRFRARGLAYAADHPLYVAEVSARNLARLTGLAGADWWRFSAGTIDVPNPPADVAAYEFLVLAALALAGLALPARRRIPVWLLLLPVALLASVLPLVGETRFRAPIDPFVVILAAVAVVEAPRLARLARRRRPAATA
jgi:4-amino-4-deoxy-L-arabinose transferase-like glycosyltransferase